MELTILGSHGTWPGAGGATSGLLVRDDGFSLWVDAGSGTLANLQRHMGLYEVGAIVISHSHPDHVSDLYAYFYSRLFGPEPQPKIPLYVAPKVVERVNPLLTEDEGEMRLAEAFDVVVVEPGEEHHIGPFLMATAPMQHTVPTIGVRIEGDEGTVAYSADTGPTEEVTRLASRAEVFVVEASWQGERRDDQPPIHLTARQAGQTGASAGVGRMLLTHIRPYMDED
ncbi:MAG: MBL fold metallo-hydrolase, partial [Actinomycetota bacterium]|nr:MBL fold metallo-hydrolase [Actinomycetota bacterium]